MKHLLVFMLSSVALVSVAVAAQAQDADKQFIIKGHVTNIPDSTKIRLSRVNGKMLVNVGETVVIDGQFTFTGEALSDCQELALLSGDRGFPGYITLLWVAPGETVRIEGDGKLMPLWTVTSSVPRQQSYSKMNEAKMPEFKRFLELNVEEYELLAFLYQDKKGAQEYVKPTWAKIDSIRALSSPLDSIMDVKVVDYMKEAPIDEVWLNQLKTYVSGVVMGCKKLSRESLEGLYKRMSQDDLSTPDGKVIHQYLTIGKILEEGDEMADAKLYDAEGKEHFLSEHKGKYILLDFWSAGCGPCIQSIPEAEEVADEYADRLVIVSISQDPKEIWLETLKARNMKGFQWNELNGDNVGISQKYGTVGIPHYVLINPEGKIQKKWSGYGNGSLRSAVAKQLEQKQ